MTIVKYMSIFYSNNRIGYGDKMISYEPFWRTLKSKGITTYTLINKYNISSATIDRMKKGGGISTMKIDDFCQILDCNVDDIITYIPEK